MHLLWLLTLLALAQPALAQTPLTGPAAKLYRQAQDTGHSFAQAEKLHPDIVPTSDGKSYFVVWKTQMAPSRWIVSLHGAGFPAKGFATDDLAVWYPHLKDRDVGLGCLQWWLGIACTGFVSQIISRAPAFTYCQCTGDQQAAAVIAWQDCMHMQCFLPSWRSPFSRVLTTLMMDFVHT